MLIATVSVILLVVVALGWREAVVVAVAVPVTLALTLLVNYLYGYTLNRVTLFALIFSIGILVDDAIVVVENIHRHFAAKGGGSRRGTGSWAASAPGTNAAPPASAPPARNRRLSIGPSVSRGRRYSKGRRGGRDWSGTAGGRAPPQLLQTLVAAAVVFIDFKADRVFLVIVLVVILGGIER